MMSSRVQSKKLAINHVRDPGERMPVGSSAMQLSKRPDKAVPADPFPNDGVLRHIIEVVVISKAARQNTREYQEGKNPDKG